MSWLLLHGGAYAVPPYVNQGAVEHYPWLSAPPMIDRLVLVFVRGMASPGYQPL
ncbi:hypothetical protein [Cupriavidus basilensis]|uniref:Uncharacterized protein n=1 Tax=Cupriavidus basilensis TaxID=68895 RepID=A0A7M2H0Q9_9BURK|nr:hypothetical protein [Cupriavidus basilensis]QOT78696.1 hypothetical protein F7R26_001725 [Cupriavidus basilensis]